MGFAHGAGSKPALPARASCRHKSWASNTIEADVGFAHGAGSQPALLDVNILVATLGLMGTVSRFAFPSTHSIKRQLNRLT